MQPKIIRSGRWQFNAYDFQKWSRNTLIFLSPALLVFLVNVQLGKTPKEALIALQVWGLGVAIDFLRKLIAGEVK